MLRRAGALPPAPSAAASLGASSRGPPSAMALLAVRSEVAHSSSGLHVAVRAWCSRGPRPPGASRAACTFFAQWLHTCLYCMLAAKAPPLEGALWPPRSWHAAVSLFSRSGSPLLASGILLVPWPEPFNRCTAACAIWTWACACLCSSLPCAGSLLPVLCLRELGWSGQRLCAECLPPGAGRKWLQWRMPCAQWLPEAAWQV